MDSDITKKKSQYHLSQLIDHNIIGSKIKENTDQAIICDIDKTYLETNYDSFFDLAKIPFEHAKDKKTVSGAKEALSAARWGKVGYKKKDVVSPKLLHFVSSSPPQLRRVIREKFKLDGLDWTSDTFKNQIYNLKKRRFSLLRQQVAYKTQAILDIMLKFQSKRYFLIGDSGESDLFVYMGIRLFLDNKLSMNGYQKYLEISGVDKSIAHSIVESIKNVEIKSKIAGIYIRNITDFNLYSKFMESVFFFTHYLELIVMFIEDGLIQASSFRTLARIIQQKENMSIFSIYEILKYFYLSTKIKNKQLKNEILLAIKHFSNLGINDNVTFEINVHLSDFSHYETLHEVDWLCLAKTWLKDRFSSA